MCSAVSSTAGGRGSDIFLIFAQNIDARDSQGEVIHGCSDNIFF